MKCCQCSDNAMFLIGDERAPLCLSCNLKLVQMTQIQNDMLERQMNFAIDEMDSIVGIRGSGPRFPERHIVRMGDVTLHNINVKNSTVGVINSGHVGTIDTAVTVLKQSGDPQLAEALRVLSEAVIASTQLQENARNEVLELLSVLSTEATAPKEQRKKSVTGILLSRIKDLVTVANDLSALWQQWGPVLIAAYN